MTDDELNSFLAMGASEEDIAELLRKADEQDGIAADTRGKSYLMNEGGRVQVANPWGAVSDMVVRGNAEKKAEKARGDAANAKAELNQTAVRDYHRAMSGRGLGGVDLQAEPTQRQIAGDTRPLSMGVEGGIRAPQGLGPPPAPAAANPGAPPIPAPAAPPQNAAPPSPEQVQSFLGPQKQNPFEAMKGLENFAEKDPIEEQLELLRAQTMGMR